MTAIDKPKVGKAKPFTDERAEILARVLELLVGMGAAVEIRQWERPDGIHLGDIKKVNGIDLDVYFHQVKQDRWDHSLPVLDRVSLSFHSNGPPPSSYPRDKHGQFNTQKIAERLDSSTRAVIAERKKTAEKNDCAKKNREALEKEFECNYSYTDYQRHIKVESDEEGFKVHAPRARFKTVEEARKFVTDLQKFLDEHKNS